uniref:AP-3 complex subunit delta-1-like isoform X2 n=1 Tax=Styela clava TaxID=7725 RepID=UPI001939EADE|nr:AP-3 complex subunit delta-1-like isoform X2 [Styela clava]
MALTLKKVKGSLDRMFDKNMQDLVRGIRNHKESESRYIAGCVEEIKSELKQDNAAIKANAVNKLIYLQMLGYDISWAAFNIIEVMSSPKFTFKRIGYFAASQSFHSETDVLMLTTNMIRKDLGSQTMYDTGVALSGLSCFITPDLARDLVNDILALMSSTRPYIRKRAVLISYKIFLAYPDALRPAFPRLKEKLEDPDQGVQSAAVNVICELARKNPKNYLSLAPIFFKLMTTSTNNWVLIKIIKLFGALTPLEPRLGKKLIEPLTNLIHSTSAMSLLYECINTVIQGMTDHSSSIQLCVQKLRILIEDADQNLKYLGLLAMSRILKSHPKAVQSHKDLILQCLDDKDESIRLRALDLLFGMVSKKNLMEIVKKLMVHVNKAEGSQYRDELLTKIIEICSQQNYQYITNFEWYVTVLVELTRTEGATRHGSLISSQILDVAIRVKTIRPFAAKQMAVLLENSHVIASQLQRNGMQEVLYAAAYVCGEFAQFIESPSSLLNAMLSHRVVSLPAHIQAIYIQNSMKLFASAVTQAEENEDHEKVEELLKLVMGKLPAFVQSGDLEVQERASCILSMMKYASKAQGKGSKVAGDFNDLFKGELNPVAPKAQKKVPVPEGLDLDAWINDPPSSSEDDVPTTFNYKLNDNVDDFYSTKKEKMKELSPEERKKMREQRIQEQASNPNYLSSSKPKHSSQPMANGYQEPGDDTGDLPPVTDIDISIPLHVPGMTSSDKYLRQEQDRRRRRQEERKKRRDEKERKKDKKGRKGRKKGRQVVEDSPDEDIEPVHAVDIVQEEMPEGAVQTDSEDDTKKEDIYKALDIDLESPLTAQDKLPTPTHRVAKESPQKGDEEPEEKKKKRKKKEKKKKEKKTRHHHHHEKHEHPQESLLLVDEGEEPTVAASNGDDVTTPVTSQDKVNGHQDAPKETDKEDLDFWLSPGSGTTGATAAVNGDGDAPSPKQDTPEESPAKQHRHKKKKKHEKSSKHKKHRKEREESPEKAETGKEKTEERPSTPPLPAMTRFVDLGENEHIGIKYETRVISMQEKQIMVALVFQNKVDKQLKSIEFNVLDTLNTRLIRGPGSTSHDPVKIPFILLPSSGNEAQLLFSVVSLNMPQRLRGTVTYILKDEEGSSQHKLDFKLYLPCSAYLLTAPCNSERFTHLLSSGEVSEKSSIRVNAPDLKFSHALQKICFYLKFSVVERVDDSASLYAATIQQHHVCLLIKAVPNGISVDGKSTDSSLLSNILDEVKEIFK